jgi:hypothetical protein
VAGAVEAALGGAGGVRGDRAFDDAFAASLSVRGAALAKNGNWRKPSRIAATIGYSAADYVTYRFQSARAVSRNARGGGRYPFLEAIKDPRGMKRLVQQAGALGWALQPWIS